MSLTLTQLQTIKSLIAADATMNAFPDNSDGATAIAKLLNVDASPAFVVWRTDISASEVMAAIVGTELAALTAIKQFVFHMLLVSAPVNASKPNIQADFSAIFSPGASLTALAALAKRNASVAEKALATGTGSTASPATMSAEGKLNFNDVQEARVS